MSRTIRKNWHPWESYRSPLTQGTRRKEHAAEQEILEAGLNPGNCLRTRANPKGEAIPTLRDTRNASWDQGVYASYKTLEEDEKRWLKY